MTAEPVYTVVETTARVLCRLQGLAVTRTDTENVPRTGGTVIAINHTSYLDFIHAALCSAQVEAEASGDGQNGIVNNKVLVFLMRGCGVIEVDRSAGASAFEAGFDALHHVQDGFAHEPGAYWVPRRLGGGAPTPEEAAAMDAADRAKRAR